jgi:hypothetical protein
MPATTPDQIHRLFEEAFNAGAERISHDHTGTLWRIEVGGERLVMVEVRNSTPESDGTHRPYWLRVPPGSTRPVRRWPGPSGSAPTAISRSSKPQLRLQYWS